MDETAVAVREVREVGPDTVALTFEAPAEFAAEPGQFVRILAEFDGEEEGATTRCPRRPSRARSRSPSGSTRRDARTVARRPRTGRRGPNRGPLRRRLLRGREVCCPARGRPRRRARHRHRGTRNHRRRGRNARLPGRRTGPRGATRRPLRRGRSRRLRHRRALGRGAVHRRESRRCAVRLRVQRLLRGGRRGPRRRGLRHRDGEGRELRPRAVTEIDLSGRRLAASPWPSAFAPGAR